MFDSVLDENAIRGFFKGSPKILDKFVDTLNERMLFLIKEQVKATTNKALDWMGETCFSHDSHDSTFLSKGGCYECRAELRLENEK